MKEKDRREKKERAKAEGLQWPQEVKGRLPSLYVVVRDVVHGTISHRAPFVSLPPHCGSHDRTA